MKRIHTPAGAPHPGLKRADGSVPADRSRNRFSSPWMPAGPSGVYAPSRTVLDLDLMEEALTARCRGERPTGRPLEDLSLTAIQAGCDQVGKIGSAQLAGIGDFPALLSNVASKLALDRYQVAARSYRWVSLRKPLRNFHPTALIQLGKFPQLQAINEHAEFKYGSIDDSAETIQLATFGRIFHLTRQALVNDDLQEFNDLAVMAADAVVELENRLFFALLLSGTASNGPTLSDGLQYFDAGHGNLMVAAALDATSLGLAMAALRGQSTAAGALLNLEPSTLLVGPQLEIDARKTIVEVTPSGDRPLRIVVDAFITDASWYLSCDPTARPAWVRGGLEDAPFRFQGRTDFHTSGIAFKCATDFGVAPGDWRAMVRNPGL